MAHALKGPWTIWADKDVLPNGAEWTEICSPAHGGFARVIHRMEDGDTDPCYDATSRLIAAAPELLEALNACLQCFDEMKGRKPAFVEDSIAMGKEAVAKATGEPS